IACLALMNVAGAAAPVQTPTAQPATTQAAPAQTLTAQTVAAQTPTAHAPTAQRATAQAPAPEMPAEYKSVLQTLGKTGDFKANVLKVNVPRSDLSVTVAGVKTPTPFGFGGWVAMTKGDGGHEVLMGDLVLTEDEVNPVMSALLDNGIDVTALHNHFFWEQ